MENNEFSLYTKYELRGRGTAFKAYVPIEIKNNKVKYLGLSAGTSISEKDIEEFNNLVKSDVRKDKKSLVEVKDMDKEEIDKLVKEIKKKGGKVTREEKEQIYKNINR